MSRSRAATALAGTVLGAAVALVVVTLTRAPEPYGDEAWDGSIVWSFAQGRGLHMSMAEGIGLYEGTWDHWVPRIWLAPALVAQVLVGPSFTAYRAVSLVLALAGLLLLVLAIRRHHPTWAALLAAAAVATTWVFFSAAHYVRWDSLTFLWAMAVYALLVWGPPTAVRAFAVGLVVAVGPDFFVPTFALAAPAAILVAWERAGRGRRVAWFAAGTALGLVAYAAAHLLPDPGRARAQFDLVYSSQYRVPLPAVLRERSLDPLLDEADRWRTLAVEPYSGTRLLLVLGLVAALGVLARAARGRDYPWRAVAPALLVAQLAGLAALYANKGPVYVVGAAGFAAASVVDALTIVPERRVRDVALAVVLALVVATGGRELVDGVRASPAGAATDPALSRLARSLTPPRGRVLGDYVYWWLFRDERFRFNGVIWFERYRQGASFEAAFAKACPDVVVYDDIWKARYTNFGPESLGARFPGLAPTDPGEQAKLERVLAREYRRMRRVATGGRIVELWRRTAGRC